MKKYISIVLSFLILILCLCSCDTNLTEQSNATTQTTTYQNFKASKSNDLSKILDYDNIDLFVADTILCKTEYNPSNKIAYPDDLREWKYKQMTEVYKEIDSILSGAKNALGGPEFWISVKKFIDGDIAELSVGWKMLMYTELLMDYLTYNGETEEFKSNFDALTAKYISQLTSEIIKPIGDEDVNEILKQMEPTEVVQFLKDNRYYESLNNFNSLLFDVVVDNAETALEMIEKTSKALALKDVESGRVEFLRSIKDVSDDEDIKKAVDFVLEKYEMSCNELTKNELILNEKTYTIFNSLTKKSWELICSSIPGVSTVFKTIKLGEAGLNWMFNAEENEANKIQLYIMYNFNNYAQSAFSKIRDNYISNSTIQNAILFNNTTCAYYNLQGYTTNIADKYLLGTLFKGAYNEFKNLFSNEAEFNYEYMGSLLHNDIDYCNKICKLIAKWYGSYKTVIGSGDIDISPEKVYTWLVEPTIEADDIIVFDESIVPNISVSLCDFKSGSLSGNSLEHSKYAIIKRNNKYGYIGYDTEIYVEPSYPYFNGCSCGEVSLKNGKYGEDCENINLITDYKTLNGQNGHGWVTTSQIYDKNSKTLIEIPEQFIDKQMLPYKPMWMSIVSDSSYYYEYTTGGVAQPVTIDDSDVEKANIVSLGEKYALHNNFKLTTDFIFDLAYSDKYGKSGIAACKKDGKWGYYSYDGKEIIPCQFDDVENKLSYFKSSNGEIYDETYEAYLPTDGYIAVNKDGGYGYYNTDGKEVIPCGEFEQARPVYDRKAWVKKDGKWGVIKLDESTAGKKANVKNSSLNNNSEQQNTSDNNTTSRKYPDSISPSTLNELGECAFICTYDGDWTFLGRDLYIAEKLEDIGVISINQDGNKIEFKEIKKYNDNSYNTEWIASTNYSSKNDEVQFKMFLCNNSWMGATEQLVIESYKSEIGLVNMKPRFELNGTLSINRPLSLLPLKEIDWSTVEIKKASNGRNYIAFKMLNSQYNPS